ncbi:hypothetical protein CGH15_22560 [Vibrio parahaemolyticus]|nr:hypothetical protein CGH15_22560 [Vibrio parahaemolyticus]
MAHVLFARFCAANFGILVCGSWASIYSGLPSQKQPCLLKISSMALSFQKGFWVLLVRFLRRCMFQVVSVTSALKLRLI